jgi:hypothetical protein
MRHAIERDRADRRATVDAEQRRLAVNVDADQ